jgi:hypothetical protein
LSEQEEIASRVISLQEHLESVEIAISFEGSHHPSPTEMALLEHQQQSIIRELEEKSINNFSMPKPVDWDARLEQLLEHVHEEWRKSMRARFDQTQAST